MLWNQIRYGVLETDLQSQTSKEVITFTIFQLQSICQHKKIFRPTDDWKRGVTPATPSGTFFDKRKMFRRYLKFGIWIRDSVDRKIFVRVVSAISNCHTRARSRLISKWRILCEWQFVHKKSTLDYVISSARRFREEDRVRGHRFVESSYNDSFFVFSYDAFPRIYVRKNEHANVTGELFLWHWRVRLFPLRRLVKSAWNSPARRLLPTSVYLSFFSALPLYRANARVYRLYV